MNATFYYLDKNRKLCVLGVSDAENIDDARQAALEHLFETRERFLEPLLGVIDGGKQ